MLPVNQYYRSLNRAGGPDLGIFGNATIILSVQKLNPSYTGPCWRVRRVSDSVTQDIGFDSGGLVDSAALASFLGTGQGRLVIWYDQKGSNNCTAPTTALEPLIWNNGFYLTFGKPTVFWESALRRMVFSSEFEINSANGSFSVFFATPAAGDAAIMGHTTLNRQFRYQAGILRFVGSPNDLTGGQTSGREGRVCGWELYKASSQHRVYDWFADGTLTAYVNTISYKFNQLACVLTSAIPWGGNISEFIYFDNILTADVAAVKTNRKTYFGT